VQPFRNPQGKAIAAAFSAVCLAVVMTGCGSSGSSSSGPSASNAPKGKPVTIGLIVMQSGVAASAQENEWTVGTKAAAAYINDKLGGFGGRPLKVDVCDSKSTSAGALTCANQLVADKVDMVSGFALGIGADALPVFTKAGIPVQSVPISAQEYSSPDSFPYGGGSFTEYPANAAYATSKLGSKKGVLVVSALGDASPVVDSMNVFFHPAGGSVSGIPVPATTADLSPEVAEAIKAKPDTIFTALGGVQDATLYEQLLKQGFSPRNIIAQASAVDVPNFFSKVSPESAIEGSLYCDGFVSFDDTANPDVATYLSAMKTYENDAGRGVLDQWSFSTVMTNYNIAKKSGFATFDSAALTHALNTETVPVFMGYQYNRASAPKDAPAVGNPDVLFVRYQGGKVVIQPGGWVNGVTGAVAPFDSSITTG
jgi:branched-chain amino acid transport system substrate-binding protein